MRALMLTLALLLPGPTLATAEASQTTGGLQGRVLRGPISPICVAARPCQVPVSVVLGFRRNGNEVARVKSTRDGDYRVALAPGVYRVVPVFRQALWRVSPHIVRVPVGHYARVNFLVDTGIP